MPVRLCIPKAWGAGHLCWGDAAYTPPQAARRWACGAGGPHGAMEGPGPGILVSPQQQWLGGRRCGGAWEACQTLHGSVGHVRSLQWLSSQQPGAEPC